MDTRKCSWAGCREPAEEVLDVGFSVAGVATTFPAKKRFCRHHADVTQQALAMEPACYRAAVVPLGGQ